MGKWKEGGEGGGAMGWQIGDEGNGATCNRSQFIANICSAITHFDASSSLNTTQHRCRSSFVVISSFPGGSANSDDTSEFVGGLSFRTIPNTPHFKCVSGKSNGQGATIQTVR